MLSRFAKVLRVVGLATVVYGIDAPAQTPPPPAASLDEKTRRAVIDSVTVQVERLYVDADTGRMIADALRRRLRTGSYDGVTDPRRLALMLTTDLRSVNGDLHLGVVYAPSGVGPFSHAMAATERLRHYALGRVDVLAGNVGYLEVTGFSAAPEATGVLVAALRYLETTDAMIIDVRRNSGGSPALANLLASHFMGADTVATVVSKVRGLSPGSIRTATQYTLASVPGPRRPDVPLYVLTSRGTVSAGEWFSFTLQNLKRATIVGERTAGAGHNVAFMRSGHGFSTTISYSRVTDARTGKEWERVGVQPDVRVEPAAALDAAHSLALGVIGGASAEPRRRELALIRETVDARARPYTVPAGELASYVGTYEGDRQVTLLDGRLQYRTPTAQYPETLVALSDSSFALGTTRLVFGRDERGRLRIRALLADGSMTTFARVDYATSSPARK